MIFAWKQGARTDHTATAWSLLCRDVARSPKTTLNSVHAVFSLETLQKSTLLENIDDVAYPIAQ